MNKWWVYEFMKSSWRDTERIPTAKEVALQFPDLDMHEKREGMIEFQIAYENAFSKEAEEDARYELETSQSANFKK